MQYPPPPRMTSSMICSARSDARLPPPPLSRHLQRATGVGPEAGTPKRASLLCCALIAYVALGMNEVQAQSYDLPSTLPAGSAHCDIRQDMAEGNVVINVNSLSVATEFPAGGWRQMQLSCMGSNLPAYVGLEALAGPGAPDGLTAGYEVRHTGSIGWMQAANGIGYVQVGTTPSGPGPHSIVAPIRKHLRATEALPPPSGPPSSGIGSWFILPPGSSGGTRHWWKSATLHTSNGTCAFPEQSAVSSPVHVDAASLIKAPTHTGWNGTGWVHFQQAWTLSCGELIDGPPTRFSVKLTGSSPPGYPHLLALDPSPGSAEGVALELVAGWNNAAPWRPLSPSGDGPHGQMMGEIREGRILRYGVLGRYVDISSGDMPLNGGVANATAVMLIYYH